MYGKRFLDFNKKAFCKAALKIFPFKYYNFINIFSKAKLNKLFPLIKKYWYNIKFRNTAKTNPKTLSFSPLYKLTLKKIKKAKCYIVENLAKSFIKPSATA